MTRGTNKPIHVCSFEAVDLPPRKAGYEAFREAVLKAGRFSVFEATENMHVANLYDTLSRDSKVRLIPVGFPWTKVEAK